MTRHKLAQWLIGHAALPMAQTSHVEGRLTAILQKNRNRAMMTRKTVTSAIMTAIVVLAPLAAVRPVARGAVSVALAGPPVDAPQLHDGFTLRYAATITDDETVQSQLQEYQKLRADYVALLKQNPHFTPVPEEYYQPFSYYQSRRPRVRHLILTVSAYPSHLLYRSEENGDTFTSTYNGHGTQLFHNGHAGRTEPGLTFADFEDCPLPGVGLPSVPLFKSATMKFEDAVDCVQLNEVAMPGVPVYAQGEVNTVTEAGATKVLAVDGYDQHWTFSQHRRFQGLWVATRMRWTQTTNAGLWPSSLSFHETLAWSRAHSAPLKVCDYRLLSVTKTPLNLLSRS